MSEENKPITVNTQVVKKVTFGRVFWPSFVAVLIASIVGIFLFFIVLGGFISSFGPDSKSTSLSENAVLHMKLEGLIAEKAKADFDPTTFKMEHQLGLNNILHGLDVAKNDKKIKGIFLEIGDMTCGMSTARELRDAINDFEKSGKFVVAYNGGEVVGLRKYYISSAANEIYAFPTSPMEFVGLGGELSFFKNTLDKMDVEMQVIRGKNNDFKSAVEPLYLDKMSDSSRVQVERYITMMWKDLRNDIAKDRKVSAERLNQIADELLIRRSKDAVKYKLIDGVKYRDEVLALVAKKAGVSTNDLKLEPFEKFARKKYFQDQTLVRADNPNVAVILAEGDVSTDGDGLTSKEICKLFQDVRKNKSIKTVVFRINSPGGSALASDEIWREVKLTNEKKKVIVSMGDVAASGGYYVAAPANYIFAEPTTITGSIGVFGVIPYTGKLMEDHLGVTFDRVGTNKHSVLSTNKKLSEEEMSMIQGEVDMIYDDFLDRVATGRGMTKEQVNVIARGRVWTGRDALRIGLVDKLGGLNDAIAYASKTAKLKSTKVLYYPLVKEDKFADFIEQIADEEENLEVKQSLKLPESLMKQYSQLKSIENMTGMQMRMPFMINFN